VEVDTKQSDFISHKYKTVDQTLKNDLESKYVDYLLLDGYGSPLAIIEAKRTSRDPVVGKKQAEQYADDIKNQTGKDVFIFLSNGYEIWLWDRKRYPLRQIKGFYTRSDLERLRFQNEQITAEHIRVNTDIADRPKSIENVKRIQEHIHAGHRKALIVMATGTGKTRVAMAIIDILMRERRVQKVLFLADRKALRNQAWSKGFQEYFPHESKETILAGKYSKEKRLYVSTIQTFQEIYNQKDEKGQFLISPGEFDLIISDEAHRSIYNKWKDVFTYLDAIQIGLTATPADLVERDTFRFFNCDEATPTALFSFEEAVRDGILCDFKVNEAQTHFQVQGLKPRDIPEDERYKLLQLGIDPDDFRFEGTELEKKIAIKGTSEAIVREFMENCFVDQTGQTPAKSIIFAISKDHAKRLWEAFEKLYPEFKGRLAQIIVSEDSRAQDLIREFTNEEFPRVAISVDMLDTGIDVPEVCNLVFAKPVFSHIKFWQMLGRGTRSDQACHHKEWLPNGQKEYFRVFDFWNNFEYWRMDPKEERAERSDAISSRIFLLRLKQLDHVRNNGDKKREMELRSEIERDIRTLPIDSVSVKENREKIEKALSPKLWDNVGLDPMLFLKTNIMPLMRFKPEVNIKESSFVVKCERLALATLENDREEIERLKTSIGGMVERLPRTLDEVAKKETYLDSALTHSFWNNVSYDDSKTMVIELSPLMKYLSREKSNPIIIDMGDTIERRAKSEIELKEPSYVTAFRLKVEDKIQKLIEISLAVKKIMKDEPLTEADLAELEGSLSRIGIDVTEESVGAQSPRETLVDLVKKALGVGKGPDAVKLIEDAFQTYMIENNKHYNADQLNFIRTLETVFLRKKKIEMADLWEAPFSNFGINAPMPMFEESDLNDFIELCHGLGRDLFIAEV
jgi:type I restriction enzyme, R subunit